MTAEELLNEVIPYGRENAISRYELASILNLKDREARKLIQQARRDGMVICNFGNGYYQTDDLAEMKAHYLKERSRALSILQELTPLRRRLKEEGVEIK